MSNEISVTAKIDVINGYLEDRRNLSNFKITQDAVGGNGGIQSIGTAAGGETIVMGDVSTKGWAWFRNIEAAGGNYVDIGLQVSGTFYPLAKLEPGEPAMFRINNAATVYARADTGAVNLLYMVLED